MTVAARKPDRETWIKLCQQYGHQDLRLVLHTSDRRILQWSEEYQFYPYQRCKFCGLGPRENFEHAAKKTCNKCEADAGLLRSDDQKARAALMEQIRQSVSIPMAHNHEGINGYRWVRV